MLRLFVVVLIAVGALALPSPLSGSADDRLYGSDCSQWCFNGTDVLQPEVFGTSNSYCPDSRGCNWHWRVSFAPCSLSLLDFDALVGPDQIPFSQIDPAAVASTQLYCSQSDTGVVVELRPHSSAPIMTWHYRDVTCAELMANFASRQAEFMTHEVGVSLGGDDWFANGLTRLEDKEVDCETTRSLTDDLNPCTQCFRGVEEPTLPANGWDDVCGAQATTCQVEWRFCYDACHDSTSKASIRVGSASLKEITGTNQLTVQCAQKHGRAVLALTDADSIDALDAGQANVYLAWEYRDVECDALMRAPRRHALFVERHFALQRQAHKLANGTVVDGTMLAQMNILLGGLDERVWLGADGGASKDSDSALSSTEIVLIVLTSVLGVGCIIGWLLVLLMWRRAPSNTLSFSALMPTGDEIVSSASMWGDSTPLASHGAEDTSADDRRAELKETIVRVEKDAASDMSHLWTDRSERREKEEQRQTEIAQAQSALAKLDQ